MSALKRNVVANLAGSAWAGLMALAFIPWYIRLMGVESYGLVGVFVALSGVLLILDLGLAQAITREMARLSSSGDRQKMADTLRTLEIIYWPLGLCVAGLVIALADLIAYQWLNPESISRSDLRQTLGIMALAIGLRWPLSIYAGGLNGLQRQVALNSVQAIFATAQGVGALLVLWLIEPSAQAYFAWVGAVTLLQVWVTRMILMPNVESGSSARFSIEILRHLWQFAAGMTGISLLTVVLTQADKVLLSKILSLTDFGYYAFAANVAAALYRIIGPIFTAYYPRFTELVALNDQARLVRAYHQGCQLMAVMVVPVALVLGLYSLDILQLWTGDPTLAANAAWLVSALVAGNALNGFMHLPYALQLAHGWTRLALMQNVLAVVFLVPGVILGAMHWGAIGAALAWVGLNLGYMIFGIPLMHRRLLRDQMRRWYACDVAKILGLGLMVTLACRFLVGTHISGVWLLPWLILVLLGAWAISFWGAETLRLPLWARGVPRVSEG